MNRVKPSHHQVLSQELRCNMKLNIVVTGSDLGGQINQNSGNQAKWTEQPNANHLGHQIPYIMLLVTRLPIRKILVNTHWRFPI